MSKDGYQGYRTNWFKFKKRRLPLNKRLWVLEEVLAHHIRRLAPGETMACACDSADEAKKLYFRFRRILNKGGLYKSVWNPWQFRTWLAYERNTHYLYVHRLEVMPEEGIDYPKEEDK